MRYAIINGTLVENVAIADAPLGEKWIASEVAGPGWKYENGVFIAPDEPEAVVTPWTKKEFLLKFTPSEYAAIAAATKSNSTLDYYWQLFMVAENVLKTDPATIAGINDLESAGLLAPGRAEEILS